MLVQSCAIENFDAATQTCSAPVWSDYPAFLPPLPVSDGLVVASAMLTPMALAWAYKAIRRFIWTKGV